MVAYLVSIVGTVMSVQEAQVNTLIYKTFTVAIRARYLGRLSHIRDKHRIRALVNINPDDIPSSLKKKLRLEGYQ